MSSVSGIDLFCGVGLTHGLIKSGITVRAGINWIYFRRRLARLTGKGRSPDQRHLIVILGWL